MWMLPATPWILGIATLVIIRLEFGMILELFGPKSIDGGETVDRGTLPVSPRTALIIIGMLVGAQVLFWSQTAVGLGIGLSGVGILLMSFISSPYIPKLTQETLDIKPEPAPTPSNPSRGIGGGKRKRKGKGKSQGKKQESPQVMTTQRPPKQPLIIPEKEPDQVTDKGKGMSPYIWLALIFAVALVLRFYRLDDLPYGLWRDEARHGLIALHMLQESAYRPIYVAANGVNMPALGFYPFALVIKLFGVHDWTMRTITALAGALTVFPLYALVKEQFKSVPIALLAAALLAASSWHITLSRFSFPSVFEPLLALTGLWLLMKVIYQSISTSPDATTNRAHVPKASLGMLVVAGVCLGLAVQNYHTGRVVPVVALLLLFITFTIIPFRRWLKLLGMLTAGMVLALLPLLIYATTNPAAFNQRVGRVFIMGEESREGRAPLAVLDETVGKHAMMFNLQGDSNGRHHAPDKPMLDFLTGLGLLIGLGVVLRLWMYFMFLFPALAAAISIAPSLLAVEGPHAMRSIGAIAFVVIIASIGYTELGATLRAFLFPYWQAMRERPSRTIMAMSVALMAIVIALNSWTYFGFMAKEPAVWVSSYPIHTQIGSYLRDQANHAGAEQTTDYYVDEKLSNNSVFVYLTYGLTVQTFHDTTLSRPLSDEAKFIVSGYTYEQDAAMLAPYIGNDPSPIATGPLLPDGQSPSFYVYAANPQGTP
jgi:4-amino-4-deoxy-L-arabinose transferase-like glycosyltransferase